MVINDKVYLNDDLELRLFYYNNDPAFKDHELDYCKAGMTFTIVGYVPEKSNNIRTDEASGDFENYSYVLKSEHSLELFRVNRDLVKEHFVVLKLN